MSSKSSKPSKSDKPKRPFVPTVYGKGVLPKVGQRVRLRLAVRASSGTTVAAGTLCDVIDMTPSTGVVGVSAYVRDGDTVVVERVVCDAADLQSVKGKPFVAGVDERRMDRSSEALAGKPSVPSDDCDEDDEADEDEDEDVDDERDEDDSDEGDEDVDALLAGLRDRLTKGGKVDRDEVVRIVHDEVDSPLNVLSDSVSRAVTEAADASKRVTFCEDAVVTVQDKLADVLTALTSATPAGKRAARIVLSGSAPSGNAIVDKLAALYTVGVDRGVNVMLCSPPSLGKSFAVRKFAEDYDLFVEHGCSADMDEIATVLGSPIPDGEGGFAVTDGVLTQAVRTAGDGKTVLLLLDEVLRLSDRVQEWLLTFLTGVKRADGTRFYRLRTRKLDSASGALEEITCEATNLHIVAATNLGMLAPVEAFWSRWHKVRLAFDPATVQDIADAVLASNGIADRAKLAKAWADVVVESRRLTAEGRLRFPADIRTLENAAKLCDDGKAATVARIAADALPDQIAHWSADLGDMDNDSGTVARGIADKLVATLSV